MNESTTLRETLLAPGLLERVLEGLGFNTHPERQRLLIEEEGISEELVRLLPEDIPTPPPPWSRSAQSAHDEK